MSRDRRGRFLCHPEARAEWRDGEAHVSGPGSSPEMTTDRSDVVRLFERFASPTSPWAVVDGLPREERREALNVVRTLIGLGLLVSEEPPRPPSCFIEVSPAVGCPAVCRACPQSTVQQAYLGQGGPRPQWMAFDDFRGMIDRAPEGALIAFGGVAEPFSNPRCGEMVETALDRHRVWVFSTLQGLMADTYDRFRRDPNLELFVVHLPDADGGTRFQIDDDYLAVLSRVIDDPPLSLGFTLHGSAEHPAVSHVIRYSRPTPLIDRAGNVQPGPDVTASPHHLSGVLACKFLWLDSLEHGAGMVLPDGTTVLCSMDWGMKHVLGNAFSQPFSEMRSSSEYRRCVEGLADPRLGTLCRRCSWAVPAGTAAETVSGAIPSGRRAREVLIEDARGQAGTRE